MAFFTDGSTYQPFFNLYIGVQKTPGGSTEPMDSPVEVGAIFRNSIKQITVTRELGKATQFEASIEHGVSKELVGDIPSFDGVPIPYLFFTKAKVGIRFVAGYKGLDPLDRLVDTAKVADKFTVAEGPYERAPIQQQATLFVGSVARPDLRGDRAGALSFTLRGIPGPATQDNVGAAQRNILSTDSRGSEVRGSDTTAPPSPPPQSATDETGQEVANFIRQYVTEVLFPPEVFPGLKVDVSALETGWEGLTTIRPWFRPRWVPHVESPYSFLRRLCSHYGLTFLEVPAGTGSDTDPHQVTFIFFPDGKTDDYFKALSNVPGTGVLVNTAQTAIVLAYGEAVVDFSFSHHPVSVSGQSATFTNERGDTFQVRLDDKAIIQAVRARLAQNGFQPTEAAAFFTRLATEQPDEFIAMFTAIKATVGESSRSFQQSGVGSGGLRLEVTLKSAIPGLRPGMLVYFTQPRKIGAKDTELLPAFVKTVYRINKVVDKFDAEQEIFSQKLSLQR